MRNPEQILKAARRELSDSFLSVHNARSIGNELLDLAETLWEARNNRVVEANGKMYHVIVTPEKFTIHSPNGVGASLISPTEMEVR